MRRSLAAWVLIAVAGLALADTLPSDLRAAAALLQPPQREALQRHADLWATWSPAQRTAFAERAAAWARVPLPERAEARADWATWRALPAAEQSAVRDAAARFATLDAPTQQALRAQFDALDASERHGWRLGPQLGLDYPRLQPLLAQLPDDERDGVLRALRAMTPVERGKLAVLVQRTPPAGRAALRRELVSTSDSNRAAWLDLRLER